MDLLKSKYFALWAVFVVVLLISARPPLPIDPDLGLPGYATKKVYKSLTDLWPEKQLSIETTSRVVKSKTLFRLLNDDHPFAYMYIAEARSKFDLFTYMVVYDKLLVIKDIRVLIYREDYGGEIASKRWLKQFNGKRRVDQMQFESNIRNISGATISARSITEGVQRLTKEINRLKDEGKL
ncbi:MAG: FMN-binding protein [Bacteroidetes bacterium]|nr:FMN-binding protein [Bacteroidota bacterium]